MLYWGVILLILGVVLELLFGFAFRPYRTYGWGVGGILIVIGVVLILLAILGVAL